jgi:hypothetical protein
MQNQLKVQNAVAAIRVSSIKQGTDGDSPEAQKEQIERFAEGKGVVIKKYFMFLESASKDQQPMQEAVDYCKNPKNNVQLFIIKSIDRFTRGGSYSYDHLKMQLDRGGVSLVDIYGIISSQKVNTLDHLGFSYKWSVYSPSQKSEILEAERAKDEMRDIMSRMIGAEIRYTQMGYWMRRPPYGFESTPVDTQNGKRRILKPYPSEADFILKMFDLRCRGTLNDNQIVDELNRLGYKTRVDVLRDKHDHTKIVGKMGGVELNLKGLLRHLENPIYTGVNCEKWTGNKPIRCKFDGLITIETFNKANRGKISISEDNGELSIYKRPIPVFQQKKRVINPDFPYKRAVLCPGCKKPFSASAARGKLGKYYPAYHCSRGGHYYRIPKKEFDETIERFVEKVQVASGHMDKLEKAILAEWDKRQLVMRRDENVLDTRITSLKAEVRTVVDKIKVLSSDTAIKYMEEDIMKLEQQIVTLSDQKTQEQEEKPTDMRTIMDYISFFVKHLDYLLLKQIDPAKKASFFGVLFNQAPTYEDLICETQNVSQITGINELFRLTDTSEGNVEGPVGLEPTTPCLKGRCSNRLSYGPIVHGQQNNSLHYPFFEQKVNQLLCLPCLLPPLFGRWNHNTNKHATALPPTITS